MSGKTVRPWQTSHPLFAVIIHDFPAGLSESEKPSASVFLHDPDQCLRLILAGRLLSHPGTNVVDSGEIMTNVHAPGIVPEIFRRNALHPKHLPVNGISDHGKTALVDLISIRIQKGKKTDPDLVQQFFHLLKFFQLPAAFISPAVLFCHLNQKPGKQVLGSVNSSHAKNHLRSVSHL